MMENIAKLNNSLSRLHQKCEKTKILAFQHQSIQHEITGRLRTARKAAEPIKRYYAKGRLNKYSECKDFAIAFLVIVFTVKWFTCLSSMSAFENAHKFVHEIPASQKAGVSGLSEAVAKAAELGLPTDEVSLKKVITASGINAASAQGGARVSVDW